MTAAARAAGAPPPARQGVAATATRRMDRPFPGHPEATARLAALAARVGPAIEADVETLVETPVATPADGAPDGSAVPRARAEELVARHGLGSTTELALLALPVARNMARAPISGYRVAAVGIEADSGDLLLGANLEFPGSDLGTTIHAEGFVAIRARRRGRVLATLAVAQARPCAHCRQTLAESAGADDLRLVDLLGNELGLDDLYPWSFRPAALGVDGDRSRVAWPALSIEAGAAVPADVVGALVAAGGRAHAPYSGAPSAAAVRLRDGRILSAGCIESVAFNPTIGAIQAVLVEVAAARVEPGEIVEAWLARPKGGSVDAAPGYRALVAAVAPGATAHVLDWQA